MMQHEIWYDFYWMINILFRELSFPYKESDTISIWEEIGLINSVVVC